MTETVPSQEGLVFPLVPKPYPEESISSWVIRFCGAYQCGFKRLQDLTGIRVSGNDWDQGLAQELLDGLLRATGVLKSDFGYRPINKTFLESIGFKLVPRYWQDKPAYAWCPTCFDEDHEPYLRWQWRYRNYTHCTKHRTLLRDTCTACGARYPVHRSLLQVRSSGAHIDNLGSCQDCGTPLGRKRASTYSSLFGRGTSFGHTWPDAMCDETIHFDFKVQRFPEPAPQPVFALFGLCKKPPARDLGSSWSKNLTPSSRLILARALMSVRREMRREKVQRLGKVFS